MKRILLRVSLLICLFITGQNYLFAQLQTIDFETATGYTTVELANNINQYWKRVAAANEEALAGTDDHDLTAPVTGFQGLSYFASEDITVGNTLAEKTLLTNALSVTASHNLELRILVAAPGSGYDQAQDYLIIEYTYNGSTFTKIGQFSGNNTGNTFQVDADMNGIGDGTTLTTALTEYTFPIPKEGTSLQIRVRAFTTASSEEIVFDNLRVFGVADATAPTVTVTRNAVTLGSFAATTDASVSFNLAFSETLDNGTIAFGDVSITNPGGVTITAPSAASLTTSDNQNYTYTIAGISAGDGALSITVGPAISDLAGNPMAGAIGPSATITIDNAQPTIVLSSTDADGLVRSGQANVTVTATFTEANGLNGTPTISIPTTATPVSGAAMSGGPLVWTYSWDTPTGTEGPITVSISAVDNAGNINTTPTGQTSFTIDNTQPTVVLSSTDVDGRVRSGQANVTITATFTEANGLNGTPTISIPTTATPVSGAAMSGGPLIWTYSWDTPSGDEGPITVSISVVDNAGNANATPTGQTSFTIDNTQPSVVLSSTDADGYVRAAQANVTITATFTEANGLNGTPTISIPTTATPVSGAGMSGGPLVWTYSWDTPTGNEGPITISISAVDNAGNVNTTPTGQTSFTIDNQAPTAVTINQAGSQVDPSYSNTVNFTVVFTNGPIDPSTFSGSDFGVGGGSTTYSMGSLTTSDNITWNAVATVTAADDGFSGTVTPSLNLNTVSDLAGLTSGSITNGSTDGTVECVLEPGANGTISVTTGPTQNTLSITRSGAGGERILLIARQGSAVDFVPVDGVDYDGLDVTGQDFFTSSVLDANDNRLIEDTGGGGPYNITGLSGGTTYHFAIFRYNQGTVSTHNNFRTTSPGTTSSTTTACSFPTAPTAGVNVPNTTGITFNWNRSNGTDETLILLRVNDGSAVTAPINGANFTAIDDANFSTAPTYGNAKVVWSNENGGTNTAQTKAITGLATGTTYAYAIYLYNPTTFCYQPTNLSGTFSTSSTTDPELSVTAGALSEPATISSLGTALSGAVGPQTNAIANFDFTVTDADGDGGVTTNTDADGAPGLISQIIIYQGSDNQITNWSEAIVAAQLSDGTTTQTANITINPTNITITSIPNGAGQLGEVLDDQSKTYTLTVALRPALLGSLPATIDGLQFDFNVRTNAVSSFSTSGSGSTFPTGQSISSGLNKNVVSVIASKITVASQPSISATADVALVTQPIFHALDFNNNRDLNINNAITVTTSNLTNLGHSNALANFTSGVADFALSSGFKFANVGTSTMAVSISSPNITSANTMGITVNATTNLISATSVEGGFDLFNNATNRSVLAFRLQTTGSNVDLNAVTFTSTLPTTGYVLNYRLYSNSSDDFSTASLVSGPQSSLTFSGLTIPYSSTPTYLFLACDVEGGFPVASPTVQFSVSNSDLTVSKGLVNAATASGTNYNLVDNQAPFIQDINSDDTYVNLWSTGNNSVATPAYHAGQVGFILTFNEPVLNVSSSKFSTVGSSTSSLGFPPVNSNNSIAAVTPVDIAGAPSVSPSRYWKLTYDISNNATGFIYTQYINNGVGGFVTDAVGNVETTGILFNGSPGDYYFYLTLPKPTNDPVFTAPASTNASITLNLNHNHGAQRATNYYIRAKESTIGSFPGGYDAINGASAPTDANAYDNGIISQHVASNAYVSGTASQSVTISGLKSGISYDFEIYPYTLSPNVGFANSIEYKNNTPSTITFSTTVASASMLQFTSAATTISSIIDETPVQSAPVFSFTITDDGDGSDNDDAPFKFSAITINQGTGNDVPVWTDVIAGATLSDGTANPVITGVVAGSTISFTGLPSLSSGNFGYIDDGSAKTYTLNIWLKNILGGVYPATIDGLNLAFSATLINANYDDGNNRLTSRLGTINTAQSGGTNVAVDVTATQLVYTTDLPAKIGINHPFLVAPVIAALDANNNRDRAARTYTPTTTNAIDFTNPDAFNLGLLTLSTFTFNDPGLTRLTIASPGAGSVQSNSPAVGDETQVIISNVTAVVQGAAATGTIESNTTIQPGGAPIIGQLIATKASFNFVVQDDNGVLADEDDILPTRISTVTIKRRDTGGDNGTATGGAIFDNWQNSIQGAQLSVGGVSVGGSVAINSASIVFSAIPNSVVTNLGYISDGASRTYTLKIWFKPTLTGGLEDVFDGEDFVFEFTNASDIGLTSVDPNYSSTLSAVAFNSGNNLNVVTVDATQLVFDTQPASTQSYESDFTPQAIITARDVNGNRDRTFTGPATITATDLNIPDGRTYPLSGHTGLNFVTGRVTLNSNLQVLTTGGGFNGDQMRIAVANGLSVESNTITLNYSGSSDILRENADFVYPTDILYEAVANQVSDITPTTGVAMERFRIRDGGGSVDTDGTSTKMASVTIRVTNYQYIRSIALYENGTSPAYALNNEISETSVRTIISPTVADYTFSGISTFEAPDNGTRENNFLVKVSFVAAPVIDNEVLTFEVKSVAAASISSSFGNPTPTGTVSSVSGSQNKIEVVATRLDVTTPPAASFVSLTTNFLPVVQARDVNANLDLDFISPVTAFTNASNATMSNAVTGTAFTAGVLDFSAVPALSGFQFTAGNNNDDVTLSIKAGTGTTCGTNAICNTSPGAINPTLTLKSNTITAGALVEPTSISSLVNTTAAAVSVFDFRINDDDNQVAGTDALPTLFSKMIITPLSGQNDISDWSELIQSAILSDGVIANDLTVTPNATDITFSGINNSVGALGYVGDNLSKTYTLKIVLKPSLNPTLQATVDNLNLAFELVASATNVMVASGSSTFSTSESENSGSGTNAIDVIATKLTWTTNPTGGNPSGSLLVNKDISLQLPVPVIEALDNNNNRDLNYVTPLNITNASSLPMSSGAQNSVTSLSVVADGVADVTPPLTGGIYTFTNDFQYETIGNGTMQAVPSAATTVNPTPERFSTAVTVRVGVSSTIKESTTLAEPGTISSLADNDNVANPSTGGTDVFDFTITDDDGLAANNTENDGNPTRIRSISITQGSGNTILNWSDAIAAAQLSDTDGNSGFGTITSTSIDFGSGAGLPNTNLGEPGYIADNANKTYTLKIWLKEALGGSLPITIDGLRFVFEVTAPNIVTNVNGTSIINSENENSDPTAALTNNEVTVVASQIDFSQLDNTDNFISPYSALNFPTTGSIFTDFVPRFGVEAHDANTNRDLDFTGTITSFGANNPVGNVNTVTTQNDPSGAFIAGTLKFPTNFNYLTGDNDDGQLTMSAGGINNQLSPSINIISSFESQLISDNSIINAGAGLTQDIDFINYQAADIITTSATTTNGFTLDLLNLFDGGSDLTDLDGASTILDDLTLGISNPQSIRRIAIYTKDISGNLAEVQDFLITDGALNPTIVNGYGTITFSNLNITAADNAKNQILVLATFQDTPVAIKDRDDVRLAVLGATLNVGSRFAPDAAETGTIGGVITSSFTFPEATAAATVGTKGYLNKLQVTATSLDFEDDTFTLKQPSDLAGKLEPIDGSAGASPGGNTGIVYARDKFGIIDTDFNSTATVTAPAVPINYPNVFINGKLDLVGMQYQNAGVGTLNVTATGSNSILLNSDIAGVGNIGNSTPSETVDVIHVTAVDDQNTVEQQTSLKGGTTNKRIFGLNFTAEHETATTPRLTGFSIIFRDDEGKPYPFTKSATDNIYKNFKLFQGEGTSAPTALTEGIDYNLFLEQTFALSNQNPIPPVDYKDKLRFVLLNPTPLFQSNYKYYLNVDIDVNVSVGTAAITPYLIDLGYDDVTDVFTKTNDHITTSVGSATAQVKGTTRKFASTKPPVLVTTSPLSGALNVDPDLNTISLKFDVPVVTFDGVINVYNRETGTLRAVFTSSNGKYVDGTPLKDQVVPTLDFAAPVGFNFKADTVYYVTIEKGVFSNTDVTQRKGISDEGFNLFGGISYSGTFYFKGSGLNAPVLSGTDATKYYFTASSATFNFRFNTPGKVYYMVVHPSKLGANTSVTAPLSVTNNQILGTTAYTDTDIIERGSTIIDQLAPNLQFATINATLTNNVGYYVYVYAENDAQPLRIATASPYGSSANAFAVGAAGPALVITKTADNTSPYSNPRFEICPNSSVKMEEPIIISEGASNQADFSAGFTGGATQTFNILLPTGFQYDVTKDPTVSFNGSDFGALPTGTKHFRFRSSTLLEINFVNTGVGSSDNIIISNLYLISSSSDIGGNIVRLGGTGLTTVPEDRVLARITSGAATAIPFTSSYDNAFKPWPYAQIANALPYKPVTYIPDNFAPTIKLIPAPPAGDYGASFFSGSGLTDDELTLSAVTLNASFNITLTHTDQNGCATTTVEQYQVYDHTSTIPELLGVKLPGVSYNIKETKIGLIPGAPDPVTNIPGLPAPTFNVNDLVSHVGLAGYQLIDLYSDIPVRTKGSGQVIDYNSTGWTSLVNSIKILNTSYPDPNLGQTFKSFNWEYSNLINRTSTTAAGVQYPYDPAGRFARIIQSSGTGNGRTFFEAGSLGIIEFTGVYQSTADFSVFVPFKQEIELFIPAVPIVEVSGQSSKAGATAIFCESGLPFTVIGYPLANASDVTGFFTLRDSVSKAVIVDPGFVDNGNGTATFNPTSTVLKNGYKTIKIEYTFKQNDSPAIGTGAFYIRVTPNPVANFITSTLCEDIDVLFTDTTLDPIPGDVRIAEWLWSFGDASSTQNSAVIKDPKHIYSSTGLYANVNLRVKTNYQCASVSPKTVDLEIGGTPTVDFTFNGVSTADPINFTNASAVSANDTFKQLDWSFGDGAARVITSAFDDPTSHKYTLHKFYDVNLKVTSTIGCVNDSTKRIVVLSRATPTSATPYVEDFEANNGMWLASSLPTKSFATNPSSWAVGTPSTLVIKIDDPTIFGSKVVKTSLSGTYNPKEESAWYSPSFDISGLDRPMVSFNSFTQMEISDGVVLEYSIDNENIANPNKKWWALGQEGEGVDWFNAQGITAKPGDQPDKDYGWSDTEEDRWVESKHALENVTGKDPIVKASRVVFRFALASAKSSIVPDGFALDNFRLGERTRTILLENFTTTDGPELGKIKDENKYITDFESAGLGTTVVKLNYHIGFTGTDPFNLDNPADPSARALYYNVKTVPYAFLDGGRTEDAILNSAFSSWGQRAYDTQTLQLGQADITVPTPIVGADGSIKFDVQVKALYNLPDATILHVAVIEQSIIASSLAQAQRDQIKTGETTLDYVLKKMLPNASGTKFGTPLAKDQSRTFTGFEYYPDATKLYTNKDDLAIIVFLQNEDRTELEQNIYQTELITGILDPPVVTGLENAELLANMEVYPNPANNEFTIQLPGVAKQSMELQLVDQVGKVVTKDLIREGTSRKTINSQDLASGIYILQIGAGKSGVVRKKILIVHQD